ncbi:hypothetical protein HCA58_08990 [Micromonospora sp. HNM0581]|uniref:hypothetical protein n=1 Tax=Micromonospora sp. HNM0581 TaxID=2716341 RepID=UPI00146BA26C|nr:hypothetical protein [Micromonospora sp. HNM0581]NLU78512.1 hypothetical protein [Micromonospora sp. HNM0581]
MSMSHPREPENGLSSGEGRRVWSTPRLDRLAAGATASGVLLILDSLIGLDS